MCFWSKVLVAKAKVELHGFSLSVLCQGCRSAIIGGLSLLFFESYLDLDSRSLRLRMSQP